MVPRMDHHLFWIMSRAAGMLALMLASVSVGIGLAQSSRRLRALVPDVRVLHEALSLATLAMIAVHGVTLLGDSFLAPSVTDLLVPFASPYMQPWTTLGICAAWALMALGLSYYARGRIGVSRWRRLHRFTAVAWLAALVHSIGEGTDAGTIWFLAAIGLTAAPSLALLAVRTFGADQRRPAQAVGS